MTQIGQSRGRGGWNWWRMPAAARVAPPPLSVPCHVAGCAMGEGARQPIISSCRDGQFTLIWSRRHRDTARDQRAGEPPASTADTGRQALCVNYSHGNALSAPRFRSEQQFPEPIDCDQSPKDETLKETVHLRKIRIFLISFK